MILDNVNYLFGTVPFVLTGFDEKDNDDKEDYEQNE